MARLMAAPPPWTTTGFMPTVSMKTMSSRRCLRCCSSSMTLPPSLITVTLPRNWRIQVSASMSTSAFFSASSMVGFSLSGGLWGLSPLGACLCH